MFKKTLAALAAFALGAGLSVIAVAGPAAAHHSTVTAVSVVCDTATSATITWTVKNWEGDKVGTVIESTNNLVPKDSTFASGETKTFTQVVTSTGNKTLKVKMDWDGARPVENSGSITVNQSDFDKCNFVTANPPTVTNPVCGASQGSFTIPTTTGVRYYVEVTGSGDGNRGPGQLSADTYSIKAGKTLNIWVVPNSGYVLSGTTSWGPYVIATPDGACVASASAPVETQANCSAGETVSLPLPTPTNATWGAITYSGVDNADWSVTATATAGYVFDTSLPGVNAAGTTRTFTGTLASKLGQYDPQCYTPPTVEACAATSSVLVTNQDLQGFQFATGNGLYVDTQANGHYEFVDGGLRLYTVGASGLKVQMMKAVNIPVTTFGELNEVLFTFTSGTIEPGTQVRIDVTGDGNSDVTLVGEDIYTEQFWTNTPGFLPAVAGGQGGSYAGDLNDLLAAFPGATPTVVAVGVSLGGGVLADGVLTELQLGCVTYTFDFVPTVVAAPEPPTANDICGTENDSVTVPEDTADATYVTTWNQDRTLATVTISPTAGNVFPSETKTVYEFPFTDVVCELPDLAVFTASASASNATCATTPNGSIAVVFPADAPTAVRYFVNRDLPGEFELTATTTAVPVGTYAVSAEVRDPKDSIDGTKTWNLTVGAVNAAACAELTTLAFTGTGLGIGLGVSIAGGLLFLGFAAIVIRRRTTRTP